MDTSYSPYIGGKMEGAGSRRSSRSRRGFNIGRIYGAPFALATLSLGLAAWAGALVTSVLSYEDVDLFPNYAWWACAYYFCIIIGLFLMIACDSVYTYRIAAVGFLSNGLFLSISVVNSLVYSNSRAEVACAIMYILLSIITILWIFYFGSESNAQGRQFVDSFALYRSTDGPTRRTSRHTASPRFAQPGQFNNSQTQPQGQSSLRGFETMSPTTENPPNTNIWNTNGMGNAYGGGSAHDSKAYGDATNSNTNTTGGPSRTSQAPTEYGYRAKAIYSYEANPDDANEISFQKQEVLEVSDVSGRWWQARKANGETGIAPSNYLILL